MQVFEITGFRTGVAKEGVTYLEPKDSFQNIINGFIHRQVLQSRKGFKVFSTGPLTGAIPDSSRVLGIFINYLRDQTTECLAITKNFLYVYNSGTNTFDQIPMAGAAPAGGFNILDNSDYVSGTTYPTKTGANRFVFTGKGMADTYFYDGTNVKSFTLDNLDFANPPSQILTNATHIIWFKERLNLVSPVLDGLLEPQTILYSGVRTSLGNGDKFNVVGAGKVVCDTPQFLSGASILGDTLAINMSSSNWVIEKKTDPFNPYFSRKIPSVIGTNADFSFVSWNDEVRSVGKNGIITMDTRKSLRCDNKIPYFTKNEIDQPNFQLTYGGFDRENAQFLFSYLDDFDLFGIASQNNTLVSNYEEDSWSVFDWRFSVFGETEVGQSLTWNDIYEINDPSWARWDTTEEIWNQIGLGESVVKALAGDNYGNIYQLNTDYDDFFVNITGISQAVQAVVTISATPFIVGDLVTISNVVGMTQINNFDPEEIDPEPTPPYRVVAVSADQTQITIDVDSRFFTAWASGGTLSKVIAFSAEMVPFNPWRSEGRKCFVSYLEFLIDVTGGELLLDVFSDEDESPFMSNILLKPTNTQAEREWVSVAINQESNFLTFKFKQNSPSVPVKITSIRIHAAPGALTGY